MKGKSPYSIEKILSWDEFNDSLENQNDKQEVNPQVIEIIESLEVSEDTYNEYLKFIKDLQMLN